MIENEPDPLRRIPVKHAADIRAEVGAVLRAARLKRGASLEAVAQQTRIPKRYLEALENDRFSEFPAIVYLRGFMKEYCEHLDLDFSALWAKIEAPAEAEAPAKTAPAAKAPAARAHTTAVKSHSPAAHAPEQHAEPSSSGGLVGIVMAVAAIVGLGIWLGGSRAPQSAAETETTPRVLMPMPHAVAPVFSLHAEDDVWVQVSLDGVPAYEGRMPRGATMEWKPTKTVSLRTTAASSLSAAFSGAPTPMPAPSPDGDYRFELP